MQTTAVKERQILFSPQMVRALLAGRKRQTRRIHKFQPNYGPYATQEWTCGICDDGVSWQFNSPLTPDGYTSTCPYGQPGDRLWVRETWRPCEDSNLGTCVEYRAGGKRKPQFPDNQSGWKCEQDAQALDAHKWHPSIHMPRWASRLTLEVTGVRVERLQAISHLDAMLEGVEPTEDDWERFNDATIGMEGWEEPEELVEECEEECDWINYGNRLVEPREHKEWERDRRAYACWFGFQRLWDRINGEGSWDSNPWVWVVGFDCLKHEQVTLTEPSI